MGCRGSCTACGDELALHRGRPVIGDDGVVVVWCDACWSRRDELPPRAVTAAVEPVVDADVARVEASPLALAPRRARLARVALPASAVALASAAVMIIGQRTTVTAAAVPDIEAAAIVEEAPAAPAVMPVHAAAGPIDLGPDLDLDSLDEQRPTLIDWVHPVTGTDEKVPARSTARFGAKRDPRIIRPECGAGHCGVDLGGPRGRPVVSVAWGTVVRVEHEQEGRDGRSGRYVRIEHPDGVFTSYMHLDAIAADLKFGDEVEAGEVIGTLGKTAIHHGPQHVHFTLEIMQDDGILFLDPAPFLDRAQVAAIPEGELRLVPAPLTPEEEAARATAEAAAKTPAAAPVPADEAIETESDAD